MQYRKFFRSSHEKYVFSDHDVDLDRFMREFVDEYSYGDFIQVVYEHIGEFMLILKDYTLSMQKKIDYVIKAFMSGYFLMLVSGARGSGKTCFGFWLLEEVHERNPNKRIAYVGVKVKKGLLPSWIQNYTIEEYETLMKQNRLNGYLVLIDEAAIFFNARRYQKEANIQFGQTIAISRHKHISLLVLAQDHNMTDTNIWRLRDMVVYKKSNTYELSDRDSKGVSRQAKIQKFWKYIKQWLHPRDKDESLFEYQSEKRLMLFKTTIPRCWTNDLSESFSKYDVTKDTARAIEIPKQSKRQVVEI